VNKLEVRVTDSVFILGQGVGTVTKVLPDGSFVVKVQNRGEQHYSVYGTLGSASDQRVFYQDPILVTPPRNDRLWRVYSRITKSLYNELMALDRVGGISDE
jgi:hypothetical protein